MTGEELKDWRKSFKLSQRGLGRLLGCTGQTISNWESAAVHVPPWVEKHIHSIAYLQDTLLEDIKQSRAVSVLEILGCSVRLEFDFEDSGADQEGNLAESKACKSGMAGFLESAKSAKRAIEQYKSWVDQQEKQLELGQVIERMEKERQERALR